MTAVAETAYERILAMSYSENLPHQLASVTSEMLRQQDLGPVNLQDHSNRPGIVSVSAPPLSAAAMRAADVAHYRRLLASAVANGLSPSTFITALQALGTGGS
jgi:hypothetical protein